MKDTKLFERFETDQPLKKYAEQWSPLSKIDFHKKRLKSDFRNGKIICF